MDKITGRTEVIEKLNLNSKIGNLANDLQATQRKLNELDDQADQIKKQNLNSRLKELKNPTHVSVARLRIRNTLTLQKLVQPEKRWCLKI